VATAASGTICISIRSLAAFAVENGAFRYAGGAAQFPPVNECYRGPGSERAAAINIRLFQNTSRPICFVSGSVLFGVRQSTSPFRDQLPPASAVRFHLRVGAAHRQLAL